MMFEAKSHKAFLLTTVAVELLVICLGSFAPIRGADAETAFPVLQVGHYRSASAIAISPDNRTFVTGGQDGTIKFWDRASGVITNSVKAHVGGVNAVAFSPDGKFVISGGSDTKVRLWESITGNLVRTLDGPRTAVSCVAISADGEVIAAGSGTYEQGKTADNVIRLWKLETEQPIATLNGHGGRIRSISFSPDGSRLVSGALDSSVRVWSTATGRELQHMNTKAIESVSFSPDGLSVVSAAPKEIVFWNVSSGQQIRTIPHSSYSTEVSFTPDWRLFALGTYQTEIWDVASSQKIKTLEATSNDPIGGTVDSIVLSNDGRFLAGTGHENVIVWDVSRAVPSFIKYDPTTFTTGVAFNRTGTQLAWGYGDEVQVWDVLKGSLLHTLKGHTTSVNEVTFSPDGRYVVSCSDLEVLLWDAITGKSLRTISKSREEDEWEGYQSVAFSPNGKLLAIGGWIDPVSIRLLDARNWKLLRTLKIQDPNVVGSSRSVVKKRLAHAPYPGDPAVQVHSIAFSPDSKLLAAGDDFNMITIWDVGRRIKLRSLKGHTSPINSVAFSSNGQKLVSGGFDGAVKIWEVSGWTEKTLGRHESRVTSVKFSPDNQYVISGGLDRTIRVWDVARGSIAQILEGHNAEVTFVASNPDGLSFVSTSMDGQVKTWSLRDRILLSTFVNLDQNEWISFAPDGYFTGTSRASTHIVWRVNNTVRQGADFARTMFNPNRLLARNRGTEPAFLPSVEYPKTIPLPRITVTTPLEEEGLRREWQGRRYYALVIGNDMYKELRPLENAVNDATAVARLLQDRFGFELRVKPLLNATREQIENALQEYEAINDPEGSLLIYYAGHGTLKEIDGQKVGYWQPIDAGPTNRTNWISSDFILQSIKLMKFAHILVVSDSCFSGAILRGQEQAVDEPAKMLADGMRFKSRTLLSSGGLHPSFDSGDDGHSVFGGFFLKGLMMIQRDIFSVNRLYYEFIYVKVRDKAKQYPELRSIKGFSDDEDGMFIFVRNH